MVEMCRAQSSGIAGEFSKVANVGAVVHDIFGSLVSRPVAQSVDNVLKGSVEGLRKVERVVEDAIGQLATVGANLVETHLMNHGLVGDGKCVMV